MRTRAFFTLSLLFLLSLSVGGAPGSFRYTVSSGDSLGESCNLAVNGASAAQLTHVILEFSNSVPDCSDTCSVPPSYFFEFLNLGGGGPILLCAITIPIDGTPIISMQGTALSISGFDYNRHRTFVSYAGGTFTTTLLAFMTFGCDGQAKSGSLLFGYGGTIELSHANFSDCGTGATFPLISPGTDAVSFVGRSLIVENSAVLINPIPPTSNFSVSFEDSGFPASAATTVGGYSFTVSPLSMWSFDNCVFGTGEDNPNGFPSGPHFLVKSSLSLTNCVMWVRRTTVVFEVEHSSWLSVSSTTIDVFDSFGIDIVFAQSYGIGFAPSLFFENVFVDIRGTADAGQVFVMNGVQTLSLRGVTVIFDYVSKVAALAATTCLEVQDSNFTSSLSSPSAFSEGCLSLVGVTDIVIVRSHFQSCQAISQNGGAISASEFQTLHIIESTFVGNTGQRTGGVFITSGLPGTVFYVGGSVFERSRAQISANYAACIVVDLDADSNMVTLDRNNYTDNEVASLPLTELWISMAGVLQDYNTVVKRVTGDTSSYAHILTFTPNSEATFVCGVLNSNEALVTCLAWSGTMSVSGVVLENCPSPFAIFGCPTVSAPTPTLCSGSSDDSSSFSEVSSSSSSSTTSSSSSSTSSSSSSSQSGTVPPPSSADPTLTSVPPSTSSSEVDFLPAQCSEATSCFECATMGSDLECGWCESSSLCSSLEAFECEEKEEPVKECGKKEINVGAAVGGTVGGAAAAGGLTLGFCVAWRLLRRRKRQAVDFDGQQATPIVVPSESGESLAPLQAVVASGASAGLQTPVYTMTTTVGSEAEEPEPRPDSPSLGVQLESVSLAEHSMATTRQGGSSDPSLLPTQYRSPREGFTGGEVGTGQGGGGGGGGGGNLVLPGRASTDLDTLPSSHRSSNLEGGRVDAHVETLRPSAAPAAYLLGTLSTENDFLTTRT